MAMTLYIIVEHADGISQPVAVRTRKEAAVERATMLATQASKRPARVEQLEGCVMCHATERSFVILEVADTDIDPEVLEGY